MLLASSAPSDRRAGHDRSVGGCKGATSRERSMSTIRLTRRRFLLATASGLLAAGGAYSLHPQLGISAPRLAALQAGNVLPDDLSAPAAGGSLRVPPLLAPTMEGATKTFALTMAP